MLNPFSSSQFHLHIRSFGIRGREHGGGREAKLGREKAGWEGCLDGAVLHDLIVVKLPRISAAVFG